MIKTRCNGAGGFALCWEAFLLFAVLCLSQGQATAARLYPVDDTDRNPAFRSYVRKLQAAVDRRSMAALRKLVDEDVVVGARATEKGWATFTAGGVLKTRTRRYGMFCLIFLRSASFRNTRNYFFRLISCGDSLAS